jgi:hypothetical protein
MVSEPQHIMMILLAFRVDGSRVNRRSRNTSREDRRHFSNVAAMGGA